LQMSYRFLEHATDAVVEVEAPTLEEALKAAGDAVIHTTLNPGSVEERETREFAVEGGDLRHLLLNWLEEVIYLLITEGFAIKRIEPRVTKSGKYAATCRVAGEPINLSRHGFKVEIKAPTFHDMEITLGDPVRMRFLLDL